MHIRDNAESIAFYQGEAQESVGVRRRFGEALRNFNVLIGWQRNLEFFTTGYGYFVTILPALIVAPRYFAGEIDFGAITQASFAFSQVLNALSLVVSQFESLSAFIAGINRLADFEGAIASPVDDNLNKINTAVADQIALQQVTLQTPNYQNTLVRNLSLAVEPGRGLLVVGQSGSGKSSLLRALGWSCALSDRRYCFYPSVLI